MIKSLMDNKLKTVDQINKGVSDGLMIEKKFVNCLFCKELTNHKLSIGLILPTSVESKMK